MNSLEVWFVASTDSYLKWIAHLAMESPPNWVVRLILLKSTQNPSLRQAEGALVATEPSENDWESLDIGNLLRQVKERNPDRLVLGVTGPSLELIRHFLDSDARSRNIPIISGSPGVAFDQPVQWITRKAKADVVICSSRAEREQLLNIYSRLDRKPWVALSTLPFLDPDKQGRSSEVKKIIFVPQPDVPGTSIQRTQILLGLDRIASRTSGLRIFIKLRALSGEEQTHRERFPYDVLLDDLIARGAVDPRHWAVRSDSMTEVLQDKSALVVTVSSTAAIEAIARKVPTILIGDFGLNRSLLNGVFRNSGLMKPLDSIDVIDIPRPNEEWLSKNYFHDSSENDWLLKVSEAERVPSPIPSRGDLFRGYLLTEIIRLWLPNKFGAFILSIWAALKARD